jgi:hypothetical protein
MRKLVVGVVVVLAAIAVGCGGDDDDATSSATTVAGAAGGTEPSVGPADDGGGVDDGSGGETFDCPVTAEQASEILGATVEKNEETCFFSPGGGTAIPAAGFFGQEQCDDQFAEVLNYSDPYDGLDVDAWVRIDGQATAELLVCADPGFSVFVDTGTLSDDEADAAIAMAKELAEAAMAAG